MMPKGVEHCSSLFDGDGLLQVKIPMMPKGVEHNGDGETYHAETG